MKCIFLRCLLSPPPFSFNLDSVGERKGKKVPNLYFWNILHDFRATMEWSMMFLQDCCIPSAIQMFISELLCLLPKHDQGVVPLSLLSCTPKEGTEEKTMHLIWLPIKTTLWEAHAPSYSVTSLPGFQHLDAVHVLECGNSLYKARRMQPPAI